MRAWLELSYQMSLVTQSQTSSDAINTVFIKQLLYPYSSALLGGDEYVYLCCLQCAYLRYLSYFYRVM